MKRNITYMCLFGSLVIFCLASDLIDTTVLFLLFGIVPGKSQPLSPQEMLAFYLSFSCLLLIVPFQKYLLEIERTA